MYNLVTNILFKMNEFTCVQAASRMYFNSHFFPGMGGMGGMMNTIKEWKYTTLINMKILTISESFFA